MSRLNLKKLVIIHTVLYSIAPIVALPLEGATIPLEFSDKVVFKPKRSFLKRRCLKGIKLTSVLLVSWGALRLMKKYFLKKNDWTSEKLSSDLDAQDLCASKESTIKESLHHLAKIESQFASDISERKSDLSFEHNIGVHQKPDSNCVNSDFSTPPQLNSLQEAQKEESLDYPMHTGSSSVSQILEEEKTPTSESDVKAPNEKSPEFKKAFAEFVVTFERAISSSTEYYLALLTPNMSAAQDFIDSDFSKKPLSSKQSICVTLIEKFLEHIPKNDSCTFIAVEETRNAPLFESCPELMQYQLCRDLIHRQRPTSKELQMNYVPLIVDFSHKEYEAYFKEGIMPEICQKTFKRQFSPMICLLFVGEKLKESNPELMASFFESLCSQCENTDRMYNHSHFASILEWEVRFSSLLNAAYSAHLPSVFSYADAINDEERFFQFFRSYKKIHRLFVDSPFESALFVPYYLSGDFEEEKIPKVLEKMCAMHIEVIDDALSRSPNNSLLMELQLRERNMADVFASLWRRTKKFRCSETIE